MFMFPSELFEANKYTDVSIVGLLLSSSSLHEKTKVDKAVIKTTNFNELNRFMCLKFYCY
ncbi:hypothetical protein GCM10009431_18580 [Gaetbulibacter jejuensis]|uniref:Uncharacterized protein n=1 Tax=Gaetbulibacter jejuensis TaxID=584607 RepID=A0ABN1JQ63_9FLAO